MSFIPQAMSGRKIQHDIKFDADGAMSGLVDGVQSMTLGSGTTELSLTEGANQLQCHILQADPSANCILKLPGYVSDEFNLVGRRITIANAASTPGKLITLQDARGAAGFICYIGYQDSVDLVVLSQSSSDGSIEFGLLTKEFRHKITTAGDASADILPAAGADVVIVPKYFVLKGTQDISAGAAKIQMGAAVDLVAAAKMPDLSAAAEQVLYSADFADVVIQDNQKVNYVAHGSATATVDITLVYSLIDIA